MRIRAFGVQSPPVSDIRRRASQLLPRTFAGCAGRRATRYADRRKQPFKQADMFRLYTGDRVARRQEIPFFQTLIAELRVGMPVGRGDAEKTANNKKTEACRDRPHLGAPGPAEPETLGQQSRFGRDRRTGAQARRSRGRERGSAESARALA